MPARRNAVVVDAPSNLGLRPASPDTIPGCWRLPEALRREGIVARLAATDGGRVGPPAYTPDHDATGTRNGLAIAGYSVMLADRLGEELAVVTGRGPQPLADLEGRRPLVRDADVVALGHHDPDPAWYQDVTTATAITVIDADQIRRDTAAEAAANTLAILGGRGLDGFWVHVDVDVLDGELMPAVDSPEPGGLDYQELTTLLRALIASDLAVGVELTIFDPDLDRDGHLARELATVVVDSLSRLPTDVQQGG